MAAVIGRLTAAALVILLILLGGARLNGRGEDPAQALAAYARYLPGHPVPGDVSCHWLAEYPGAYGEMCTVAGAPYCQRGYLVVQEAVITDFRLTGCEFPAAYLIAQHGHPERVARYRRVVILIWTGMSAQVRHTGWFNPMQQVSSVGWW